MIRPVLRMGDARLLRVAQALEQFDTPELHALIADMQDTMAHLSGAGLAAPQIGVDLRVVIFGVESNPRFVNLFMHWHLVSPFLFAKALVINSHNIKSVFYYQPKESLR